MIKGILIGDSVLYGSHGPGLDPVNERLAITPRQTLNASQRVYDFCYDYSRPGSNFQDLLSPDPARREVAGLPGGIALADLLLTTDAGAVLINLGGNDHGHPQDIPGYVNSVAAACTLAGKAFGFVGVVNISVPSSYAYQPVGSTYWDSLNLSRSAAIAGAAEMLRQTCLYQHYPFVDVRNRVPITNWANVTGDVIHPNQAYSIRVFRFVARTIARP
jgi:hypothetical protein